MKSIILMAMIAITVSEFPYSIPSDKSFKDEECMRGNGEFYRGTKSLTTSNMTCKSWKDTKYPKLKENYCRNPDNSNFPWCYPVGGKGVRGRPWEFCNIPICYGTPLSVMSYNLLHNIDLDNRVKRLPAAIMSVGKKFNVRQPDVIFFQEAIRFDEIMKKCVNGKTLQDLYPYNTGTGETRLISKFKIVDSDKIHGYPYAKVNMGTVDQPKFSHFVSVALSSGPGLGTRKARLDEIKKIIAGLKNKNIPESEPVIIGGDMNVDYWANLDFNQLIFNYDYANMDTFDKNGKYSPSSWDTYYNWMTFIGLDYYQRCLKDKSYPLNYGRTIDHIGVLKSNLLPAIRTPMKVLPLKAEKEWEYKGPGGPSTHNCPQKERQGPATLKGSYPGRKFILENGTIWYNPVKTDNKYNDLSDHFPVLQEFFFRFLL